MRTWGVGMDDFDLVVLGAGAAGMMGALAPHKYPQIQ